MRKVKYLLLSIIVTVNLFLVSEVKAQVQCPANWTNDPNTLADDPLTYSETGWNDFKELKFNYQFSIDDLPSGEDYSPSNVQNISIDVETNAPTAVFTRIYANLSSVLYPFIGVGDNDLIQYIPDTDVETRERWNKYNCIDGQRDTVSLPSQQSGFSLEVSARLTGKSEDVDRFCVSPITGDKTDRDSTGGCPPGYEPRTDTSYSYPEATVTRQDTSLVSVPYRLSLRDIARKTAYTVKNQYCVTSVENSCLNDNYVCLKEGDVIPGSEPIRLVVVDARDPAANGKDGVCYLTEEALKLEKKEILISNLCTRLDPTQVVDKLSSKICHYGGLTYSPNPSAANEYMNAELTIDNSDNSTNTLAFDTELFADNNETADPNCDSTNPSAQVEKCKTNGYFRRAIKDKLAQYSVADLKVFDSMKYRISMASNSAIAYEVTTSPNQNYEGKDSWLFDYVEKLGSYVFMSEEARFMNPTLLPPGNNVVANGPDRAVYLRGGQTLFNNFVVTNRNKVDETGNALPDESTGVTSDFEVIRQAIDAFQIELTHYSGTEVGLYQAARDRYLDQLFLQQSKDLLLAYYDYFIQQGIVNSSGTTDPGQLALLQRLTSEYNNRYTEFRENMSVGLSSYNPTLDCLGSNCLITYIAGDKMYAALSRGLGDIRIVTRMPGGNAFRQVTHRAYLTFEGNYLIVYSNLTTKSYSIVNYDPNSTTYSIVDLPDLGFLNFTDAYYDPKTRYLHIVSFNGDEKIADAEKQFVIYKRFEIGGLNSTRIQAAQVPGMDKIQMVENGGKLFGSFRPGPSVNVTTDLDGNVHLIAVASEAGYPLQETFANRLMYRKLSKNGELSNIETIISNQVDKDMYGYVPRRSVDGTDEIATSRILSNSGRSIVSYRDGLPVVVFLNRVWHMVPDDSPRPEWEIYYQAMSARRLSDNTWSVKPYTDRVPMPYGELRNVFISHDSIGVTVNDLVTRRNIKTKMLDAAGEKQCVYSGNIAKSVLLSEGGSDACGKLQGFQYVRPNGGSIEFVNTVRPN